MVKSAPSAEMSGVFYALTLSPRNPDNNDQNLARVVLQVHQAQVVLQVHQARVVLLRNCLDLHGRKQKRNIVLFVYLKSVKYLCFSSLIDGFAD
jgi:hypothetical protein